MTSGVASPTSTPVRRGALAGLSAVPLLDLDLVDGPGADDATQLAGGLLLLHGAGGDKSQLRELGEAVRATGVTAAYPSLRGHGASPSPTWGQSPLDFVADLHRVADVLPDPLHVVGYSYGGLVGALSAMTWAAGRVRSLVLLDTSFRAHPDKHEWDAWAEGSYLRWCYDYSAVAGLLNFPVLLLAADASPNVSAEERDQLASLPEVQVVTVPGDHASCLEAPSHISASIRAFHASLPVELSS